MDLKLIINTNFTFLCYHFTVKLSINTRLVNFSVFISKSRFGEDKRYARKILNKQNKLRKYRVYFTESIHNISVQLSSKYLTFWLWRFGAYVVDGLRRSNSHF